MTVARRRPPVSDVLEGIYRARAGRLAEEMALDPLERLRQWAEAKQSGRRSLSLALARARPPALIAEIKRASPSAGLIASNFDVAEIAARYQRAGADAISVLTEADHFQGDLGYLELARARTTVPLLRKDFLTTAYEVVQSAAYGADAVLAIVAGLSDQQLRELLREAHGWRLDVLVEVHSASELDRALAVGATLLGINNRDLRTLAVDIGVTEELIGRVPAGIQVVSESGFGNPAALRRVHLGGVPAFLVGEALMRAADPASWIRSAKQSPASAENQR
jgi:indole-3-glycerol phosphate synthase